MTGRAEHSGTPARRSPALSEDVQNRIGQQLRAMFDGVADEPIPDRLLQVLQKLESEDKK